MGSYKIEWKAGAERDLRSIDSQHIPRIIESVEELKDNPFNQHCHKLKGAESLWRRRVGNYRVIYQVNTAQKTITIIHVRHRKEAYR